MVKVMLVDDYAPTREVVRLFLGQFKDLVVVGEAADGREAVRLAGELQPDVIVMDVAMPVMNGLVATKLVTEANPQTRVITLTGHVDPAVSGRAAAAGSSRHLTKPFDLWALAETIRDLGGVGRPAGAPLCSSLIALDGSGQGGS